MAFIPPALAATGKILSSAATSTFLQAAGTGLTAYGAYASGRAQQSAAEYNAAQQRQAAELARLDVAENARRREDDKRRAIARLKAQYGAQGLDPTSGAPLDMMGETASRFDLEIADMYAAADRRATAYENAASLSAFEGRTSRTAGLISTASALAGGFSDFSDRLIEKQDKGIPAI